MSETLTNVFLVIHGLALLAMLALVPTLIWTRSRCGYACGKPEGGCAARIEHAPIVHSPYREERRP